MPGVKTKSRSGQKRSWSKSKVKPGKTKRMRKRARLARSGSALTQPGSGLPETGNGLGDKDDGREDVVILGGADLLEDSEMEVAAGPEEISVPEKPVKRMSAATRCSRKDGARPLTYDELIEGEGRPEVMFPDDLDFQFEIPPDVEDVEIW